MTSRHKLTSCGAVRGWITRSSPEEHTEVPCLGCPLRCLELAPEMKEGWADARGGREDRIRPGGSTHAPLPDWTNRWGKLP